MAAWQRPGSGLAAAWRRPGGGRRPLVEKSFLPGLAAGKRPPERAREVRRLLLPLLLFVFLVLVSPVPLVLLPPPLLPLLRLLLLLPLFLLPLLLLPLFLLPLLLGGASTLKLQPTGSGKTFRLSFTIPNEREGGGKRAEF